MEIEVTDVPEKKQYEARSEGGAVAGFAAYEKTPTMVVLTHTEVDPAFEGQGVGSALARGALDHVRGQGLRVLPLCPFIRSYITRHPEYADLEYRQQPSTAKD